MVTQDEMTEVTYIVPDMGCDHCEDAVSSHLLTIAGVEAVGVDLDTQRVSVYGQGLDVDTLRESIDAAGYHSA